jgi:hypothetical protein
LQGLQESHLAEDALEDEVVVELRSAAVEEELPSVILF